MSKEVKNQLSICELLPENSLGEIRLKRIADIYNGVIVYPQFYNDEPKIFGNRELLYINDPSNFEIGYIGVWEWSAIENYNDPNKDYVQTRFAPEFCPIEIEIVEAEDLDEMVNMIKDGIDLYADSNKILIGFKQDDEIYECILCRHKDLSPNGNKYILSTSRNKLPVYKIHINDVVKIDKKRFCKNDLNNAPCSRYYELKKPLDIVKEIVLNEISWPSLKNKGYVRDTYQKIKHFIDAFDTTELDEKIVKELECSEEEAASYLNVFFNNINDFLNAESFVDLAISSILQRDDNLMKKISHMIEEDWKKENREKISESENKLNVLINLISDNEKKVIKLNETIGQKQNELIDIQRECEVYSRIGDDVQKDIKKKIEEAKNDISSFVSEVTFLSSINNNSTNEINNTKSAFIIGEKVENNPDENSTWEETLSTFIAELEVIGLTEKTKETAAVIYSCYVNKYPILLAGPFGGAIANAFSVSINSHTISTLSCIEESISSDLEQINDESIVLVKNLFNSPVKDEILEKLSMKDSFFIFTIPFVDELQIESKELLNYMFPIFTEDLFTSKPNYGFVGGICAENYKEFIPNKTRRISEKIFKGLATSNYLINRLSVIISNANQMISSSNDDIECYFFMYPIALLAERQSYLRLELEKNTNITSSIKEELLEKLGKD